jgi:preprotein translocase subunit SecD
LAAKSKLRSDENLDRRQTKEDKMVDCTIHADDPEWMKAAKITRKLKQERDSAASEYTTALRERVNELERTTKAIIGWLEQNQPSVFQRGLWDAIEDA